MMVTWYVRTSVAMSEEGEVDDVVSLSPILILWWLCRLRWRNYMVRKMMQDVWLVERTCLMMLLPLVSFMLYYINLVVRSLDYNDIYKIISKLWLTN